MVAVLAAGGFCLLAVADVIHFFYWLNRAGERTEAQVESVVIAIGWILLMLAALRWGRSSN